MPALRLLRTRIWLASAMWVPVLAANLVAVALGLAMPRLDDALGNKPTLPLALSTVEQTLGALAAGMITFTGIVFSAVLVAAQIQTSSYSPRLAARLRRDRVVIAALALPTATANYSLFALASLGREVNTSRVSVAPALTAGVALALTFVTFAVFVALVQRALDSTQIGGILRGLMGRAYQVIEEVHPPGGPGRAGGPPTAGEPQEEIVHLGAPGVLASIDRRALIDLAEETGGFVDVVPMIGQYVAVGTVVLRLHGAQRPPSDGAARRVLVLARQRSMDQDPAFALRMLVDIAIRALSPAVNDPTTAVQTLDRIETLLVELHGRTTGPALVADARGTPRGRFPAPTWEEYLDLALMEIRHYGRSSAQVARRLRALHDHLLAIVDESERARIQLERRLLDEELLAGFPDEQERAILRRPDRLGLGSAR
jgi:uncharacterized membrane protein